MNRYVGAGIVLGLGILLGTAAAKAASDSGWLVLAGPALLALLLILADMIRTGSKGGLRRPSWTALILAGSVLLSCRLIAAKDPARVAIMIPILGGGVATPLILTPSRCGDCRL